MDGEAAGRPPETVASVADCLRLPALAGAALRGGHAGLRAPVRWAATGAGAHGCAPGELRVLARLIDPGMVGAAGRGGAVALAAPLVSSAAGEAAGELGLPAIALAPGADLDRVVGEVLDHVIASLDSTLIRLGRVAAILGAAASDDLRVASISEALAAATGLPVLVEDAELEVLSAVGDTPQSPQHGAASVRPEGRSRHPTVAMRDTYARLAAARRPLRIEANPSIGLMLPRLVSPVVGAGEVLGFCTLILRSDGGGDQVATAALEQATHLVAAALLHRRGAELGGRMIRGGLLLDLLGGRGPAELLQARASQLGVELGRSATVALVQGPAGGRPERWRGAADAALGRDAGLVDVVGDRVVAVLAGGDRERWRRWAVELVSTLGGGVAVLGRTVPAAELPAQYLQARRVAELSGPGGRGAHIHDLEDLGLLGMLVEASSAEGLERFWRSRIGTLHEHDHRRGTDLCGALAALLDEGGLRPAARRLGVHPNSLAHRLERARSIGGLALDDPERRLELQVALRCRDLLDR